ncbi:MAG: sulfotransferase family protein, partial [Thermodesulfobacteriota bacterium]
MQQIIALWTHPRSISTALERVMMERGDLKVLHEPFSYLYYVESGKATIPQEYEDPNHPRSYDGIKDFILGHGETKPVFFKDMCAHCH